MKAWPIIYMFFRDIDILISATFILSVRETEEVGYSLGIAGAGARRGGGGSIAILGGGGGEGRFKAATTKAAVFALLLLAGVA